MLYSSILHKNIHILPKVGRCGERFSLFFANSMVFAKKPVKTKKPANAKRADRQKHAKKHRAKAVFFQVRTQGRLANCPLGICAVRRQSSILRYFVFEILHCVQNDKWGFVGANIFYFVRRGRRLGAPFVGVGVSTTRCRGGSPCPPVDFDVFCPSVTRFARATSPTSREVCGTVKTVPYARNAFYRVGRGQAPALPYKISL